MRFILCLLLILPAFTQSTDAANLEAEIQLLNNTGSDKTDWPIFLTVYKVFGSNLDLKAINPHGFHVSGLDGQEIPHMVRPIPPDFSVGNDEIVFLLPKMRAGETLTFRITNSREKGTLQSIDLVGNANNMLPNTDPQIEFAGKGGRMNNVVPMPSGRSGFEIVLPVGAAATARIPQTVTFRKDGRYHFSFWAKTENVAYTGWGFWNDGATISFDPPAFRGRDNITLRGTRDWYCYTFDAGGSDDWGVPDMTSIAQAETVKQQGKDVPAEIWRKDGKAILTIKARQADQPFLKDDKTGRLWFSEILLFEQPVVTVNRTKGLDRVARNGAIVFGRPINMPRMGVFAHEATERLETFAMPGERRAIRFGIHAVAPLHHPEVFLPSSLKGKTGELPAERLELERLSAYVEPYDPPEGLAPGAAMEFLLSVEVPLGTPAGEYTGSIKVTQDAGGKTVRELPLKVEILPFTFPTKGYWIGGIYNTGMGLARDKALYECYAKTGFNYILLFDYLFRCKDGRIDWDGARKQVDQITKIAKVTAGIGLYREPNMSEDQPRLWYQIAAGQPEYQGTYKIGTRPQFRESYQKLARQAYDFAQQHEWPPLLFMVSDEPGDKRDVDASMGWLKQAIPQAVTLADVQFKDMIATWQWYSLPVFDDPIDWTGPFIYEYTRAQGHPFYGFCGTGWALDVARYQPGLMLASSGAVYWHFWHLKGPFEPRNGKVVRSHAVAAMAEGLNDYRYYILLKQRMDQTRKAIQQGKLTGVQAGRATACLVAAQKYLDSLLAFATADHDRHLMPYNGVPETWGDDRFYDDWRAQMKDHLLRIQDTSTPNGP